MSTLDSDVKAKQVAMIVVGAIAGTIAIEAASAITAMEIPEARARSSLTLQRYAEAVAYMARWHMQGVLPSSPATFELTDMAQDIFRHSEVFGAVEVLRHLAVASSIMNGGAK